MYGTSRQHTPHRQLARATATEASFTSRGDTRRQSRVPAESQPLLSRSLSIPDKFSLLPLATLDLSTILSLKFQRAGISTVGQLLELELEDFERLGIFSKSLEEVVQKVLALDVLEPIQNLTKEPMQLETGYATSAASASRQKNENRENGEVPSVLPRLGCRSIRGDRNKVVVVVRKGQETSCRNDLLREGEDSALFPVRGDRNFCYEVDVNCLPLKYRDRVSRRKPSCWVATPVPSTIRPGYFLVRIGSTPEQLRDKRPVEVSEEEATRLSPVSQVKAPNIKVAPAFLLPEPLRRVISSGVSRPMTLREWEGQPPTITPQEAQGKMPESPQTGASPSPSVPIPQHIMRMPIERLGLSLPLAHRLKLAGITRVGQLLEMQGDAIGALSIGAEGLQDIACCLQAVKALPSTEAQVYDEVYLAVTDQCYTDEQGEKFRMVHASAFPDRLPGEGMRSGAVYTLWMLQEHLDQAMDWDREHFSHLDTHTLRVMINEHARKQGAVAPPLRVSQRTRTDEDRGLSASKNISIRLDAVDGLLDTLPPGEETRRYRDHAGFLFGLQQEEWLALGRQAAEWKREQHATAGRRREAFAMQQLAACIAQVEDWYGRLRHKPRILGLCGDFVEDEIPCSRTFTVHEKGKKARRETLHWTEKVKRLVGYQLVIGAPSYITWPEDWAQKPVERHSA
jgi:hypothetical protein